MNEWIAEPGAWAIALIMIMVASWLFYRFFAPHSWREWAGAGLVQAFIIALYAEMYGFPLTIYLLARFTGLDREYVSANLWSTLVGLGETGMLISMLLGYLLAFVGIGIFIQGWRELYRAHKENRLVTNSLSHWFDIRSTRGYSSSSSVKASFTGRPCSPSACFR